MKENIDKVYSSCKEYKTIATIRGEDEEMVRAQLITNASRPYQL